MLGVDMSGHATFAMDVAMLTSVSSFATLMMRDSWISMWMFDAVFLKYLIYIDGHIVATFFY